MMTSSCLIPGKYLKGWREYGSVKVTDGSVDINRNTGSIVLVDEVTEFIRKYNLTVTNQDKRILFRVLTSDEAINNHNYNKRYLSMFDSKMMTNRNDSNFSVYGDKEIIILFKMSF